MGETLSWPEPSERGSPISSSRIDAVGLGPGAEDHVEGRGGQLAGVGHPPSAGPASADSRCRASAAERAATATMVPSCPSTHWLSTSVASGGAVTSTTR